MVLPFRRMLEMYAVIKTGGKQYKVSKDDNVVDADFEEVKDENKEKSA